jgi:hypothetical protein
MHTLGNGYRGIWLLVDLNRDRLLTVGTLVVALTFGGLIGSLL